MRRFAAIASLCLLVGLAACGNTQPPATGVGAAIAAAQAPASGVAAPSQQSLASLLTQLQTNSAADIANAIGIATAAEKTDPFAGELVTCLTWWQSAPTALAGLLPSAGNGSVGPAVVFTDAFLGLDNVTNLTSQTEQAAFENACGGLGMHLANQGTTLATQVAFLAAKLGIVVPK